MNKHSIRRPSILVFLLVAAVATNCQDDVIGPMVDEQPGRRDYKWTIDTLVYPGSWQILMRSIWGSSPSNVYAVGHNDRNRGQMWHFNGSKWEAVSLALSDGGNIEGGFDLKSVFGFGPNDIYATGERIYFNPTPPPTFIDSSLLIHFDGHSWNEVSVPRRPSLIGVGGANPNDVWVSGREGTLFHLFNGQWSTVPMDPTLTLGQIVGQSSSNIVLNCDRIIDMTQPEDSSQYLILRCDGNNWSAIDSFYILPGSNDERFGHSLWMGPNQQLYSAGRRIYKQTGNNWIPVLDAGHTFYAVYGSGNKNIFAVGYGCQVYHFNGTNWHSFDQFRQDGNYADNVWCNNDEVFILTGDGRSTFIIHGK